MITFLSILAVAKPAWKISSLLARDATLVGTASRWKKLDCVTRDRMSEGLSGRGGKHGRGLSESCHHANNSSEDSKRAGRGFARSCLSKSEPKRHSNLALDYPLPKLDLNRPISFYFHYFVITETRPATDAHAFHTPRAAFVVRPQPVFVRSWITAFTRGRRHSQTHLADCVASL